MKKFLFLFLLAMSQLAFSQNMDFRNTLSVQSGRSLFTSLRGIQAKSTDTLSFTGGKLHASPTFQAAYDFGITKWFSVGLVGSYNQANINFNGVTVKGKTLGDASAKFARTSLAVRTLFHYGNAGKLDMYSGLRIGGAFWYGSVGAQVDDAVFTDLIESIGLGSTPGFIKKRLDGGTLRGGFPLLQVQVIPFGMRYYITDNIGVNGEIATGGPYYFSLGANYRF